MMINTDTCSSGSSGGSGGSSLNTDELAKAVSPSIFLIIFIKI